MPGEPLHSNHPPPSIKSRARRIGRRRSQQPQPIPPSICMLAVIAALALSLPFCDSESSPSGQAMARTIAENLEGERVVAYAAMDGETHTTSADLRSRSAWHPWQRRVEGSDAGGIQGSVSSRSSSNCAFASCHVAQAQAQARHARGGSVAAREAPSRHPAEDRVRQARRVSAFVSPAAGRPLARRGHHQAGAVGNGSHFPHCSSAYTNSASLPRPSTAQPPQTCPQRPQSSSPATRCHLAACSSPRSTQGRSCSQVQTTSSGSGDGNALPVSPSRSVTTGGGPSFGKTNGHRDYSWMELPRVTETNSFSTTVRASQQASQWASRRGVAALGMSAEDSSIADGGESGTPPQLEQVAASVSASVRAPLLVTIGPQCAGKTTLLRTLSLARRTGEGGGGDNGSGGDGDGAARSAVSVRDVAIDDHPSVYYEISIDVLVDGCAKGSQEDETVGGRRLSDRLAEPGCLEARLVALRLLGRITAEEFLGGLEGYGGQASSSALLALGDAVESAVSDGARVSTPTVDVFVRENLFPAAISSAKRRLEVAAREERGMVAWGNTNTQARDYQGALEQAELTGRPVRFVRWGYELPFLSLEELSRRNVYRFASTGRYVEMAAIETALARVSKLYASTSGGDSKKLALKAGFEMDAAGGVRSVASPGTRGRRPPTRSGGRQPRSSGGEVWTRRSGGGGGVAARAGGGSSSSSSRNDSDGSGHVNSLQPPCGRFKNVVGRAQSVAPQLQLQPPPIARPLPVGRFNDGSDRRGVAAYAHPPLGLAQEWTPGGGARLERKSGVSTSWNAGGWRGWGRGSEAVPSTVMFGNEWGRKREWRRSGYSEEDIDPMMSSCFFRKPANSTGVLKRSDEDGGGADFEEMDLVRRIKSFRQRR